ASIVINVTGFAMSSESSRQKSKSILASQISKSQHGAASVTGGIPILLILGRPGGDRRICRTLAAFEVFILCGQFTTALSIESYREMLKHDRDFPTENPEPALPNSPSACDFLAQRLTHLSETLVGTHTSYSKTGPVNLSRAQFPYKLVGCFGKNAFKCQGAHVNFDASTSRGV